MVIQPGLIRTRFGEVAVGSIESAAPTDGPYAKFNTAVAEATKGVYEKGPLAMFGRGPEAVAEAIEKAISKRRPRARYRVTPSAKMLMTQRSLMSDRVWDAFLRSQFPRAIEEAFRRHGEEFPFIIRAVRIEQRRTARASVGDQPLIFRGHHVQRQVREIDDLGIALPDAGRLDDDEIESRRAIQRDDVGEHGARGQVLAPRRERAHEDVRRRERVHADAFGVEAGRCHFHRGKQVHHGVTQPALASPAAYLSMPR